MSQLKQLNPRFNMLWRLLGFSNNPQQVVKISSSYKDVFDGEPGKHVMADLAKECNVWTVDDTDLKDTQRTVFNEGKRSVFLYIQAMRGLNNQDYQEFLQEASSYLNGKYSSNGSE